MRRALLGNVALKITLDVLSVHELSAPYAAVSSNACLSSDISPVEFMYSWYPQTMDQIHPTRIGDVIHCKTPTASIEPLKFSMTPTAIVPMPGNTILMMKKTKAANCNTRRVTGIAKKRY